MKNRTAPLGNFVEVNPEGIGKGYPHDEILYVDISSVGSGYFVESPATLSLNDAPSRAKRIVRDGDTILATVRPNLRSFLFVKEPETNTVASTGFAVLRAKENADPRFIYYAVTDRRFTGYLTGNTRGTSYPAVDTDTVLRGEIPDFDLQRQQAIASILSAYDDLIGNNRRRIQLLEQAARLLHKEWFVHLRFPGHEHVTITDGVPEGWERVSLSSLCTVGRGGSPRPIRDYLDGTVPWYKIGDATASESPFVFSTNGRIIEDGVRKSVLLPPQELILSNSATCGVPYFTGISGCIHDGWLYFKELQRVSKWFLYCGLFAKQQQILMGIGEGATQKNLNTDYVGRQLLLLPMDQVLLEMFDDVVVPLFAQIFSLAQQNLQLAQARDLLLPRLMNGEVTV